MYPPAGTAPPCLEFLTVLFTRPKDVWTAEELSTTAFLALFLFRSSHFFSRALKKKSVPATWLAKCHFGNIQVYCGELPSLTHNFMVLHLRMGHSLPLHPCANGPLFPTGTAR